MSLVSAPAPASTDALPHPARRGARAIFGNRLALLGTILLSVIILCVTVGPFFVPYDLAIRPNPRLMLQPPSREHPLGTDEIGRDVAARLLYAGRVSIPVSIFSMAVAVLTATAIGITSGYYGGWIDQLLMRITDALLSIPTIFLLLTVAAVLRPNVPLLVLIIGFLGWMDLARILRVQTIALCRSEQIEGARALGAPTSRIILYHILPNVQGPILVAAPLIAGRALLTESVLSYLGLGIQPPIPTWGNMLNQAQQFALSAPLLAVAPGLTIMVTVIAINFIGDGLRDAFDPRLER